MNYQEAAYANFCSAYERSEKNTILCFAGADDNPSKITNTSESGQRIILHNRF